MNWDRKERRAKEIILCTRRKDRAKEIILCTRRKDRAKEINLCTRRKDRATELNLWGRRKDSAKELNLCTRRKDICRASELNVFTGRKGRAKKLILCIRRNASRKDPWIIKPLLNNFKPFSIGGKMSFPALFSILFFGLMQSRGQAGKTARPALKSTSAFDLGNRYIPNCVQVQEKTIVLQGSSLSLLFSHTEPDSFLCCPSLLFCPNLLSCPFRLCCPYLLCCPSLLCCLSLLCCPSFLYVVLPSLLFSSLLYISFFVLLISVVRLFYVAILFFVTPSLRFVVSLWFPFCWRHFCSSFHLQMFLTRPSPLYSSSYSFLVALFFNKHLISL